MEYSEPVRIIEVKTRVLKERTVEFLEKYCMEPIVGSEFILIVGDGKDKFDRLLKESGHENNAEGFFSELTGKLAESDGNPIKIGNVTMPYHYLFFMMEILMPGNGFITVKSVDQLEKATNIIVPEKDRDSMQKVIDTYPVRFSMHILRQMRLSKHIAYQYLPFVDELNDKGLINTWVGQFHQGPLEQMYQNRPIFVLNMSCPVYCRFCFRKHKECRNQPSPTINDVKEGIKHIKRQPKIKEVLLTGGDPFMNKATMTCAVDEILNIDHVRTLRIATRSIAYYPYLFHTNNNHWMEYLKKINAKLHENNKKLEIATHFLHPDEISLESLNIVSELANNGIPVYVQTPFLKDCNDTGKELKELYNKLRGAGAEIHYIFMPCTPLQGNRRYVSTVSSGINAARYLRANLTDRAMPHMCTATAIGKIDWFTSGWAVEKADEDFIWIRTPYSIEYFREFCPGFSLDDFKITTARENPEGLIDIKFMVGIGDEKLFMGSRKTKSKPSADETGKLGSLQKKALEDQRTSSKFDSGISRLHKTKAEIDLNGNIDFDHIKKDKNITDVIISSKNDIIDDIDLLEGCIKKLHGIKHVCSIRLRSLKFNYHPDEYTGSMISRLGSLNKLSSVEPKRIEIETQFLHSSEAKEQHSNLTWELGKKGITVYNNTPILSGINDNEKEFEKIASHMRNAGIEFNTAYVTGTLLHDFWKKPISPAKIIDIASNLRKNGSGREIPRYLIATPFGDADFGMSTEFFRKDNKTMARLLPYKNQTELKNMIFEDDFMISRSSKEG